MKKSVLLFASLLLAAVSAIAQPAKPEVTYTDWASVEEKAEIYLYNVEAGMFLSAGSAWGTRASLVGTKDKSTYNDLIMGAGEFKGNKWFIAAAQDQRDGKACYMFENKSGKNYLTADNKDGIWVDGDTGRPYDGWYIAKDNGDKTFQLGYMLRTEKKDEAGNVIKEGEQTVYEYSSMGIFGVQKFDEGNLDTYLDESTAYSTWAIVSASEYDEKLPAFKLYYIAEGLKKLVADAKELGIEADFSSYEALLVKEGVTYDEIKTAIDKFSPTVNFGKVIADAKKADPARDWSKYEAIYADPASTNEIFTANTNLINAFLALKKAIDDAKALDAAHSYKTAEDLYASDESKQADIEAETARVNAFASLKKKLDEATEGYPAVDFGEAKAVYDNIASTAAQCAEAEKKIDALKADYDIKNATVDKPGDITSLLTNVDGKSITDWTRTFTGEGTVGDFACNTWSVEANNGADGTNMVVNFLQVWKGKGNTLSDQKFQRNTVKVAPGAYKITGNIRIYNESGAEFMKGAYLFGNVSRNSLFANEDEAQTNAIEGAKYNTYNNMLNYWKDGFETYAIVPEDGTLTLGVMIEGANYNWVSAKDFHVYYMGNSYESLDFVRNNSDMFAKPFPEETIAMKQLLDDYNNAIPNYGKAKNAEELLDVVQKLVSLSDSVQANANAYKAYKDKVDELKKGIDDGTIDLVGDDADILFDYIDDLGEEIGPDDEASIDLGFKNGYSAYILANRLLKTEEIKTELEFLNKLYETAMRTSIKNGSDLTELLANPDFSTNDWTGWTKEAAAGGNVAVGDKCAEAWNNSAFDIYQEQEGLPDGLYEISVQGFYRYKRGNPAFQAYKEQSNEFVKEGGSPCFVYMNTMTTPFTNVFGEENKGQEFYGSTNYDTYTYGEGESAITEYYPNGMSSAAVAFDAGMYTQTAYGLVLDGEKMRVGVKGSSNQEGDSWVIFDNFKLTYRAKDPEVAQKVLSIKAEELKNLIENSESSMTDQTLQDAQYALSEAQKTDLSPAAKYEVLIETNAAYNAAKKNVELVSAYKAAEKAYFDICTAFEDIDPDLQAAIWEEVGEMDEELAGDAYMDLNNEELDDLTVRVKALTDKVNAAKADAEMKKVKEEMASASDDDPYDATGFIVNPDLSIGKADGWTVMALGQNNGYQDNNTYTNGDVSLNQFIECWRSGAILDDGTIEQTTSATLPAGTYTLGADINAKWQPDATVAIEGLVLFVSDAEGKTNSTLLDTQDASPKHFDVTFKLDKESVITLGVMAKSTNANWLAADNFKLTYYGTASAKEESGDAGDANAIEGVEEAAPAAKTIVAIYNAAGAQISTLQPGINIVKYADGTTKKIFKK
ncbi:MAG: hypothetical protein K6A93_08335 [Bacteroidaceae bacterium]|nr:hypothetical protein [Bacteroidaceae bacterium]